MDTVPVWQLKPDCDLIWTGCYKLGSSLVRTVTKVVTNCHQLEWTKPHKHNTASAQCGGWELSVCGHHVVRPERAVLEADRVMERGE
jgi:hypothetical protein